MLPEAALAAAIGLSSQDYQDCHYIQSSAAQIMFERQTGLHTVEEVIDMHDPKLDLIVKDSFNYDVGSTAMNKMYTVMMFKDLYYSFCIRGKLRAKEDH